jgi:hypothetical protein
VVGGQLTIDLFCDDRTRSLAREVAIMIAPYAAPGTKRETVQLLAERVAALAEKRYRDFQEPAEPVRCHTCDAMTVVGDRVRVAVCNRCSLEGRSVGCTG